MSKVDLKLGDCLDVMRTMADNSVVVVTDPHYGIGAAARDNQSRGNIAAARDYGCKDWDNAIPKKEYFDEIFRVSREQVIFGGNYFTEHLPPSSSWIVWDKDNGKNDFADCELAWTSHKRAVRKIVWRWQGMLQENMANKDKRVHPTQKPVGVMKWIIENYTDENDVVLDPYMGSGTTGVACVKMGRKFIGCELDPEYFRIAEKRIEAAQGEFALFDQ